MIQLLHTPEGVRDLYGEENARKLTVCRRIRKVFRLFGYQEIQTPTFEYFDIFNAQRGTIPSRDMYKLFDRDGETLVLRPDFTPAVARCAAKYFGGETLPVRLSYLGNTFVNSSHYRGLLKETTQAGAELMGDDSVDANAEIIAMVVETLKILGLTKFQIEIGDVRYFRGFLDDAGIEDEVRRELRSCIENKNHFGLEELLEKHSINGELADILTRLPQMFGDPTAILKQARAYAGNPTSLTALDRLEELYRKLEDYGVSSHITFDLGMLGTHDYYTGMIFKGYTYGTGDCIVGGGRYNDLLAQFGKASPSIGFGISVDTVLQAMSRQGIHPEGRPAQTLILYRPEMFTAAAEQARELRARGIPTVLMLWDGRAVEEYYEYCAENGVTRVILPEEGKGSSEYIPDHEAGTLQLR